MPPQTCVEAVVTAEAVRSPAVSTPARPASSLPAAVGRGNLFPSNTSYYQFRQERVQFIIL